MNKLKIILISAILGLFTTVSNAQVNMGVSVSGVEMDAVGSESTNTAESESATIGAAYYSIFVEYELGQGAIGLDVMPYGIDSETVTNAQTDPGMTDSGTNEVMVEIEYNTMLYGLIPISDTPAYAKIGYSMAKVLTNEKMHTNTSYPNDDLKGVHLSLGYQIETGNINLRVEAGYSEYEDLSVTGSGGDGTQNTVTIKDLTGPHARLSLVKSF